MVDLEDIYTERVLQLSANIPRTGRLASPDATARAQSKLCGSRIAVDLCMAGGKVTDYAQDVRACMLGQTSAAVMGANIVGSTAAELREVGAQMRAMLKESRPAAVRALERSGHPRNRARLQGAARLYAAGVRRRGRSPRQDRAERRHLRARAAHALDLPRPMQGSAKVRKRLQHLSLSYQLLKVRQPPLTLPLSSAAVA